MASDIKQDASSCLNDPNFAIVCAFLTKFASKLNVTHPNFQDLQKMLEDTEEGKLFLQCTKKLYEPCVSVFCICVIVCMYFMSNGCLF